MKCMKTDGYEFGLEILHLFTREKEIILPHFSDDSNKIKIKGV